MKFTKLVCYLDQVLSAHFLILSTWTDPKAQSTRICFCLKTDSFFPDLAYRLHVSGKNGHRKLIFSRTLPRVEIFENAGFLFPCGRTKTEVFECDDVIHHTLLAWCMLHKRCYISSVLAFSCRRAKTIRIRYVNPRSRRLEVVGERENGRARGRHARLLLARPFFLVPTTSKRLLRRLTLACMRIFLKPEKKFSIFNEERRTRRGLNGLPLSEDTILRGVSSSSLAADNLQEPQHGVEWTNGNSSQAGLCVKITLLFFRIKLK